MTEVPDTFKGEPQLPPEVRASLDGGEKFVDPEQPAAPEERLQLPERIDLGDGKYVRFWTPEELESGDLRPALRGLEVEGRIGWCHGLARGAIREWNLTAKKTGKPLPLPADDPDSMDRLSPQAYARITDVLLQYIDLVVPQDPPAA
jgi:hypothetical protein